MWPILFLAWAGVMFATIWKISDEEFVARWGKKIDALWDRMFK